MPLCTRSPKAIPSAPTRGCPTRPAGQWACPSPGRMSAAVRTSNCRRASGRARRPLVGFGLARPGRAEARRRALLRSYQERPWVPGARGGALVSAVR